MSSDSDDRKRVRTREVLNPSLESNTDCKSVMSEPQSIDDELGMDSFPVKGGAKSLAGRKPGSGGARRGSGRPKKTLSDSDPYDPVKTLKAVHFDPIIQAVAAIKEVDQKVKWMKRQPKPSMPAIAQLLNTKRALINDLLRFGYRPVPEKTISEHQFVPIDITLTDQPMSAIGLERLSHGDPDLADDLIKH